MPTVTDYLKYAETAFAAYASGLVLGQGNVSAYGNIAGMAAVQAQCNKKGQTTVSDARIEA